MDSDRIPQNKSTRHHYIPKFLIEGFKNKDGFLYVFDKEKGKILNKPQPPKSIFFEMKRNTIEVKDGIESSILEDVVYSKMDDRASKLVKTYQNKDLSEITFNAQEYAEFTIFLIVLFWRIPYTDYASEDLMKRSEILSPHIDPEIVRKDPMHIKLERFRLFQHTIDEMLKGGEWGQVNINIHGLGQDGYIIGDNPILFRRTPRLFSEFSSIDCLVALTSKRIYSSTQDKLVGLKRVNAMIYNAAIIHQSSRYVASGDYDLLANSIKFYQEMQRQGSLEQLKELVFISY